MKTIDLGHFRPNCETISGLEVRVLPGSPLTSPNHFTSDQFGRPGGTVSAPGLRKFEKRTPATRSTAFLCESETVWVYTFSVVSRSEWPSRACAVLRDSPFAWRSVACV